MTSTAPHSSYRGPVRLVLFDVDGVLTDGAIYVDGDKECVKRFNVRDGVAVALLRAHGIATGIVSGKASAALDYRVSELKFDVAVTGCGDKLGAYQRTCEERGVADEQVVFVGDDVIDLAVMLRVGIACAPADAHPLVLGIAHYVSPFRGGTGVARDVAEYVLTEGGLPLDDAYRPLTESWRGHAVVQ